MTLYLVRHAHAGSRRSWDANDIERPLSARGDLQAAHLIELLDGRPVAAVLSSPAVRCVQTVTPLAESFGLAVQVDALLHEGVDAGRAALHLLEQASATDGDVVACSHGDVIPRAMGLLVSDGMTIDGDEGPALCKKGSTWAIKVSKGRAVKARYFPPGA